MDRYQIMNGDCLDRLKDIPDGSVDLILTDPPYGTTGCKWDNVIPFEPMWIEVWRVLKKARACVLFGAEPFSSALRMSQMDKFKYDWIWIKNCPVGFVNAHLKPMNKHEIVSIFSDGKTSNGNKNNMFYLPQGLEKHGKIVRGRFPFGRFSRQSIVQEFTNYPMTVLKFGNSNHESLHPTQKPIDLLEYLIRTYTNKGETVLDFTMGSGSTGVAAMFSGRKFIGIEKDEKYFDIARRRIERASDPEYLKKRLKSK